MENLSFELTNGGFGKFRFASPVASALLFHFVRFSLSIQCEWK